MFDLRILGPFASMLFLFSGKYCITIRGALKGRVSQWRRSTISPMMP